MLKDVSVRDLAKRVMKETKPSYETKKIVSGLTHFANHPPKNEAKRKEINELISEALSMLR